MGHPPAIASTPVLTNVQSCKIIVGPVMAHEPPATRSLYIFYATDKQSLKREKEPNYPTIPIKLKLRPKGSVTSWLQLLGTKLT